ncbi:hypothetical protein KSD_53880 [Ktedonobacter sp. SOSP1-85]|uniref:hypothetical protein n=1 Tax=Ktedonobacter sp. SOSP1-85 TaxID=2778367 RepID=UPI0019156999|nr:hypothetical protein [Ktedonobacter sp. SOSP1-85]GHO77617.1 hypothetical protein KSD_53880 [Ktedonobacter sp. SOSP1-85]
MDAFRRGRGRSLVPFSLLLVCLLALAFPQHASAATTLVQLSSDPKHKSFLARLR